MLKERVDRLAADPENTELLVECVTLYHMVIEGALALTGQHFIIEYNEEQETLPGFVEGFQNVARDEHRHIAFGVRFLTDMAKQDERYREAIQRTMAEALPIADQVLDPPWAEEDDWELFGYSRDETHAFAAQCLSRRLKVIGLGLAPGLEAPTGVPARLAGGGGHRRVVVGGGRAAADPAVASASGGGSATGVGDRRWRPGGSTGAGHRRRVDRSGRRRRSRAGAGRPAAVVRSPRCGRGRRSGAGRWSRRGRRPSSAAPVALALAWSRDGQGGGSRPRWGLAWWAGDGGSVKSPVASRPA